MTLDAKTITTITTAIKTNYEALTKTNDAENPNAAHTSTSLINAFKTFAPETTLTLDNIGNILANMPTRDLSSIEVANMLCRSKQSLQTAYDQIKTAAFKHGFNQLNTGNPILFRFSTFLTLWLKIELDHDEAVLTALQPSLIAYFETTERKKLTKNRKVLTETSAPSGFAGLVLTKLSTLDLPSIFSHNLALINKAYQASTRAVPKEIRLIAGNYFFLQFINPFLTHEYSTQKKLSPTLKTIVLNAVKLIQKLVSNADCDELPTVYPDAYPSFKKAHKATLKAIIAKISEQPSQTQLKSSSSSNIITLTATTSTQAPLSELTPLFSGKPSSFSIPDESTFFDRNKWFIGGSTLSLSVAVTIGLLAQDPKALLPVVQWLVDSGVTNSELGANLMLSSASGAATGISTWLFKKCKDQSDDTENGRLSLPLDYVNPGSD